VHLPVVAPSSKGYYKVTISVPRVNDDPLDLHLLAPAFMNTRPLEIPIYLVAPKFGARAISELIAGTTKTTGALYWKAYFQGQVYLQEARESQNRLLEERAQLAIFQGCAGLARDSRFRLLFSYDEERTRCLGAGVSVTAAELADASVTRWLLLQYAAANLPDAPSGSPERKSLRDLLKWLKSLWPTETRVFSNYLNAYKDRPSNQPPFPESLAEFDRLTGNITVEAPSVPRAH
jgi:hypothetical protein